MIETSDRTNQSRFAVTREEMTTYLVEDRRALVSPWGCGNSKIGPGVFTYSKLPGSAESCPGATPYCERVCYAMRIIDNPWLRELYTANQCRGAELPELPADARLVRGHVSGDFDTPEYVIAWRKQAMERPEVLFWFYTRSWRVPEILPALQLLRELPNVEVWASVDADASDLPPIGWRRAWLDSDMRATAGGQVGKYAYRTEDGMLAIVCPEETGKAANCAECGFCFTPDYGQGTDLIFIEHHGA